MRNINYEYINNFIRNYIPESENYLKKLEEYALEENIPIIHKEVAQFLRVIVELKKPKSILEIGTAIGYSALIFASSSKNCVVTTIEKNDKMYEKAKFNISNSDYKDNIKIIKGDAKDILPRLKDKYDLIFMDAAKSKYYEFLNYCIDNLENDGLIISDNIFFNGLVAKEEVPKRHRTIVNNMRKYLKYLMDNPSFTTSLIPIGDGLALTYKRSENVEKY